jgi:serine protease
MSKIRIYLWACAFFSIALSAATAAEQTLEKREPPTTKDEALSRLMEGLLREKSPLPLNLNPSTPPAPTAKEATVERAEHQNLEADTSPSQAPQSPPAIAVGIIVRFKSPEIQALSLDNLPPPPKVIAELEAALGEKLIFQGAIGNGTYAFHFLTPKEGEEVISSLLQSARELPSIEWIEADRRVQVQSSSAPVQSSLVEAQSSAYFPDLFHYQWNLMGKPEGIFGGIDAIGAWEITHGSSDTVVAVVDTGIISHPEFSGRVLPGYNFADGPDGNGSDPGYGKDCGGVHSSWHGTHVAGIIAASGDDGSGIAGINWKTRILPVRVLKYGRSNDGDVIKGMKWAAGLACGRVFHTWCQSCC